MNLKHLLVFILLTAGINQQAMAKKKKHARNQEIKKELLLKTLRIARAMLDITGGIYVAKGVYNESDNYDLSEFFPGEFVGISLFFHGVYSLYSELMPIALAIYNYSIAKEKQAENSAFCA